MIFFEKTVSTRFLLPTLMILMDPDRSIRLGKFAAGNYNIPLRPENPKIGRVYDAKERV
jgi:hypothetical protein